MNVLVTGATGRVGANMVRRLAQAGATVTAMVMPNDPQSRKVNDLPGVRVVPADLGDQRAINQACQGITHIVHLAAQLVRGGTPVDRFYDMNAFGTLRLLEGAAHTGTVERFVLASTDGTYRPGAPPAVPLTEETEQTPADYYGTSKLLGEIILHNHAAQFDIPYSIVRFATVVSPEEAPSLFRLAFARELLGRAALGKDTNIWQLFQNRPDMSRLLQSATDGLPDESAVVLRGPDGQSWTLHLVDVRDAVEGVYLALTHPNALGRAFNIAAGQPTSYASAADLIHRQVDVPVAVVDLPVTHRLELDISAARHSLGYQPAHDYARMLHDGLHAPTTVVPARV